MGPILFFAEADLEQQVISLAMKTVGIATLAMIVLIIAAVINNKQPKKIQNKLKLPLFVLIAITMIGSTAILFGSTVYLNVKSESGGPVHWHADIEFWSCGAELDLRDPQGFLSNKIGTATYHEHNDKRIHLEGVVVRKSEDASLGKFMRVTGGYIQDDAIAIPLNENPDEWFARDDQIDGDKQYPENFSLATSATEWITNSADGPVLTLRNGSHCSGSDSAPAEVQVFVHSYDEANKSYSQRKVENPADYVIRDESVVPPADCVIVEYDVPKARTDKLCKQYGVRDAVRCTEFGVKEYSAELCNIRETGQSGGL